MRTFVAVLAVAALVAAQDDGAAAAAPSGGGGGGLKLALTSSTIEAGSFKPPYNSFDADGARTVSNWNYGGSTKVLENFVRITEDRASKRGWMWSKAPVDADQWTATLRFRVSGQGKRLFGDGLAFWFTQHQYYVDGSLHGFSDNYVGFGVLFDTFRNTEAGHVHKDVSLMINNGQEGSDSGLNAPDFPGCDGDFRYWEGRADFSVANRSTAKISYNRGKVSVSLDAKNTGEFESCIQDVPLNLPANWHKTGYIGLTATTGQLADNHDVLSLLVSPVADLLLHEHPIEEEPVALTTGNPQIDAVVASLVAKEVKKVTDKLQHLHHHLEHQLSAVHDSLRHNVKKLTEQEASNVKRIEELENRLSDRVDAQVEDTVSSQVEMTLQERLEMVEEVLHMNIQKTVDRKLGPELQEQVQDAIGSAGRGWLLPFFFLLAALAGVSIFGWMKYKHVMKTHLL